MKPKCRWKCIGIVGTFIILVFVLLGFKNSKEKSLETVYKHVYRRKHMFSMPTPKNFIDIQKKVTKKVFPYEKDYLALFSDNVNVDLSPGNLQRRMKKMSPNSSAYKFWTYQKHRQNETHLLCNPPDGPPLTKRIKAFKNILVDNENLLTFCPVYKAASTSWRQNLLALRGFTKSVPAGRLDKVVDQEFLKVANLIARGISRSTTSFMIVRDPLERLVSCYRDKYENASKLYYYFKYSETMLMMFRKGPDMYTSITQKRKWLKQVKQHLVNNGSTTPIDKENPYVNPYGPTFTEFISFIVGNHHDDEHWRPYHDHCSVCAMDYDFVLRFEDLKSDSELFIEYLNRTAEIGSRWDNPTKNGVTSSDVACSYLSQIDSKLMKKLQNKYKIDFILFNYDAKKFEKCISQKSKSTENMETIDYM